MTEYKDITKGTEATGERMTVRRSKKEFQEWYENITGKNASLFYFEDQLKSWFDPGEETLNGKEIIKIQRKFVENRELWEYQKFCIEYISYILVDWEELLSSEEGKKLIKKILEEKNEKI
jgi:hypothetical protein